MTVNDGVHGNKAAKMPRTGETLLQPYRANPPISVPVFTYYLRAAR
ncbi:MAG: hypothetical protein WBF58_18675 [Xanthobacteraceae bacterium]